MYQEDEGGDEAEECEEGGEFEGEPDRCWGGGGGGVAGRVQDRQSRLALRQQPGPPGQPHVVTGGTVARLKTGKQVVGLQNQP